MNRFIEITNLAAATFSNAYIILNGEWRIDVVI
jgi:hypothetical protein